METSTLTFFFLFLCAKRKKKKWKEKKKIIICSPDLRSSDLEQEKKLNPFFRNYTAKTELDPLPSFNLTPSFHHDISNSSCLYILTTNSSNISDQ